MNTWAVQKIFCFITDFFPFGCRGDAGHQQNNICILMFPFNREILGQFLTCIDNPFFFFFAIFDVKVKVAQSCPNSLLPDVLGPARLLCLWNSPGKNTGVDSCSFSRGSSQARDWTQVFCIAGRFFTVWATREAVQIYFCWYIFTFCLLRFFF